MTRSGLRFDLARGVDGSEQNRGVDVNPSKFVLNFWVRRGSVGRSVGEVGEVGGLGDSIPGRSCRLLQYQPDLLAYFLPLFQHFFLPLGMVAHEIFLGLAHLLPVPGPHGPCFALGVLPLLPLRVVTISTWGMRK